MTDDTIFKVKEVELSDGKQFKIHSQYWTAQEIEENILVVKIPKETAIEEVHKIKDALNKIIQGKHILILSSDVEVKKIITEEII